MRPRQRHIPRQRTDTGTASPVFYLGYLWALILAATLLSRRIQWPRLTHLALATGVVMAEVMEVHINKFWIFVESA